MLNCAGTRHCIQQIPFRHYCLMLSGLVDCGYLLQKKLGESLVLREAKKSWLEKVQVGILRMERGNTCKTLFLWNYNLFSRRNIQLYTGVFVYLVCFICLKDRVGLQSSNLSPVVCPVSNRLPRSFREQ